MNLYPRANENRRDPHDPDVRPRRRAFLREAISNFLILQVLFLGLFAYIFGALFEQNGHVHNLSILFVDYDGGSVGSAVRAAYGELQSDMFPTIDEEPPSSIPVSELRNQVCSARYWAALYVSAGASDRLSDALAGGGEAAVAYNRSDAITLVWNQARYPAVADSTILGNAQRLSQAARSSYLTSNGPPSLGGTGGSGSGDALAIFADPWTLSQVNIQPTTQGSRLIYNTLVIVLILIQEFFYLGTINGLYARFKLFGTLRARRIILYRCGISGTYTFVGSLCVTGMIWAFRVDWAVNSRQFALTWMVLWLFAHLNFLVLDICTIWLAPQFVPMVLISWIMTNITSILLPFQLSPGFYRWGYALPAHSVFQTLIDIWSGGCNPRLHISLPVLFSWWLVGLAGSILGVYRRSHYAVLAEESQEAALRARVKRALEYERTRDLKNKTADAQDVAVGTTTSAPPRDTDEVKEEKQLEGVIREENLKLQKSEDADSKGAAKFCFTLPVGQGEWQGGSELKQQMTAPSRM